MLTPVPYDLHVLQVGGNATVNGIDFYISDNFGGGMFESCKDVKFGTMNTRAIDFIGAGANNFTGKLIFIFLSTYRGWQSTKFCQLTIVYDSWFDLFLLIA